MSAPLRKKPRSALVTTYLQVHLGEWVDYAELRRIADIDDVPRFIRTLKADGWPVEIDRGARVRLLAEPMRAPIGDRTAITAAVRIAVLERDGGRCVLCGEAAGDVNARGRVVRLQVDHIVPRSRGGSTDQSNLRTLCMDCNHDKGAYHATEEAR